MEGYRAIPRLLGDAGVEIVFSMIAHTNAAWLAAGVESGAFRFVRTRHEETAGNAAVGYARSTGRLGVFTVTRGPGFANAVNALTSATKGHVPVLLVVAESPATKEKTEQNVDQRAHTAAIGAGFHHIARAEELEPAFREAIGRAWWKGHPQVLSIGDGVLESDVTLSGDPFPSTRPAPGTWPGLGPVPEPDPEVVAAVADLLHEAQRPLILAGQGAVVAECHDDLVELAGLSGAYVGNTLRANAFFAGHAADLRLCGSWSPRPVQDLLVETDVVVAFGASLNNNTMGDGYAYGKAKIVQCEIDDEAPVMASAPELFLLGDAGQAARAIVAEWTRRGYPAKPAPTDAPSFADVQQAILGVDVGHDSARGLDLRQVYVACDRMLPEDRIVVSDSGSSLGTLPNLLRARDARSWLVGRGYGSIGLGLGTAIGAAAANPGRRVALFCGDGGFMLGSQDLDAARLAGLDLTVVIMNDEQYASELSALDAHGLSRDIVRQSLPDIELLARAFGGTGKVVRTLGELEATDLTAPGLLLLDVRTDPEVIGRAVFH